MTAGTLWAVIGGVVVAATSLASAVWVALIQRRTTKDAATAVPYAELSKRVGVLEKQVDLTRRHVYRLNGDLDVVVDALHEVATWDGNPPPPTIAKAALDIVYRRRQERDRFFAWPRPSPPPEVLDGTLTTPPPATR